jgi:hypothetical protein
VPATDMGYLEDVTRQIEQRISDKLQISPDLVYTTMDPDQEPTIKRGSIMFTVCPEDFQTDQAQFAGGGRNTFVVEGQIVINLWTRLSLDRPRDASQFLREPSRGAFIKLRALINALTWDGSSVENSWQIKDTETGVPLWEEPGRITSIRIVRGQKDTEIRRAEVLYQVRVKLQLP